MPEQTGGNLTPLNQAYRTSGQGFDALVGAVQDRIKLRQQTRQMEAQLEQKKDVMTFQLEEQDRVRRSYFHDVELPEQIRREGVQAAANAEEARLKAVQDRRKRIAEIENTVRSSLMNEYSDVLRLPHLTIPVGYDVDDYDRDIVHVPYVTEEGKADIQTMSLTEYKHYLDQYKPIVAFINQFEENQSTILEDTERVDGDVLRIGNADAGALVHRLKTGNASDEDFRDILQGRTMLNIPDYTPEVLARRERVREANRAVGDFKFTWNNLYKEGVEVTAGGFIGIGRSRYKVDPNTMTVGEMLDVIREAREKHSLDEDHILMQLGRQLQEMYRIYSTEGDGVANMSEYMVNMNHRENDLITDIFVKRSQMERPSLQDLPTPSGSSSRDATFQLMKPIR